MEESCIQIKNVYKKYLDGDETTEVLISATYNIDKGDIVALTGRSGLGKSTLLKLIGTLEDVDSGEIFLDGKCITNMNENQFTILRRESIGYIFQDFCIFNKLSVYENLEIPLMLAKKNKSEWDKQIKKVLKMVELTSKIGNKVSATLSGGEKQRLAIARSMINNPSIILADEPTGNLDEKNENIIIDIFKNLNKEFNTTLLIVTHNDRVANSSKTSITIQDGKIINLNRSV